MGTKRRKSGGYLFLFLFGTLFLGAGCAVGYFAFHMVTVYLHARHWTEVPATIQHVDLQRHRGSKGGTSYKVVCTYAYTFEGHEYTSEQVGIGFGSDNIGSWQQSTYHRLRAAHQRHQSVPCFVNPADPAEALLDREIRFWLLFFMLIFPAIFGGIGLAVLSAGVVGVWAERHRKRLMELTGADDTQPWRTDPRWASGRLRPDTGSRMAWAIGSALFWNVVWSPILYFLPGEFAQGDYLAVLALIPLVVGSALIIWAVRAVIQVRKFGRSRFEGRSLPGVIGGQLRGELVISGDIATLDEVEVTLRCVNTVTVRHGGKSSSQTHTLWESRQTLQPAAARFGESELSLPVDIAIPATCRPTDEANSGDRVVWHLLVTAPAVGVDLALKFEVPVCSAVR